MSTTDPTYIPPTQPPQEPQTPAPAPEQAPAAPAAPPAAAQSPQTAWQTAPAQPPVAQVAQPVAPQPPAVVAPPADPVAALMGELAQMRQQLAELESKTSSGQLTLAETDAALASKVAELRAELDNWPQKGGNELPQPWDLAAHGLPQPGKTRDYLPGGIPDELSPVVVAHNKPILAPGSGGDQVLELATLLAKLGYSSSISKGHNFGFAYDDSVAAAVNAFRHDYHVIEDPSQFPPNSGQHETTVGPWTWEALLRIAA